MGSMCILALVSLVLATEPDPMEVSRRAAEHRRLGEEMQQLASRQLWVGVEKVFQDALALEVELTWVDLVHGAHAARGLGRAQEAHDRLTRAASIRETREISAWLKDIETSYAPVRLKVDSTRGGALAAATIPFAPDKRAALQHAIAELQEKGAFNGLLPKGEYSLEGQPFLVEPGLSVQMEVAPASRRARKRMKKAEEEAP